MGRMGEKKETKESEETLAKEERGQGRKIRDEE